MPGASRRLSDSVGVAHPYRDPGRRYEINLQPLLPYIADADWTSERVAGAWMWMKDPIEVELRNGQRITIDRFNGRFEISGIPGSFIMRTDGEEHAEGLDRLLADCLLPKK